MATPRMHVDEIDTDVVLVRRLLAGQFPEWADLAIDPVLSYGTDHDIYRIGDDLAARLPRIGWATTQAVKEAEWLPKLAPHLRLAIPVQLAIGHPSEGYPFAWSIYEWLPGENANDPANAWPYRPNRVSVTLTLREALLRTIEDSSSQVTF